LVQYDRHDHSRGDDAKVAKHLAGNAMKVKANSKRRHSGFPSWSIRNYSARIPQLRLAENGSMLLQQVR